jgi:hypothetical protein
MPPMLPSTTATSRYCGGFQPIDQRPYIAVAGTIVQALNDDAIQIAPYGWILLPTFGTTAQRPTSQLSPGTFYVDTTLSITVVWDGANWRNVITGAIA